MKIPGLKRFEATTIATTPDGSPSPYHKVAMLTFDTPEDAQAGLQSLEGQAAIQDLTNFATGGFTALLGPTQTLT